MLNLKIIKGKEVKTIREEGVAILIIRSSNIKIHISENKEFNDILGELGILNISSGKPGRVQGC